MIFYKFSHLIVSLFVKIFYRHKIYGKENFPDGGGFIVSNHSSFLDPPLIGISCPEPVHFLARETLFKGVLGWMLHHLNTHPIRKGKGNALIFKMALELVSAGKKVVIFPEGARTLDGEIQKGQLGIAMLVMRANCPVCPIYIHGTYDIWNSKRKRPKLKGRTALVFGKPLYFEKSEGLDKRASQESIVEAIMKKIADLKEWYLKGAKGTPP